MIRRGCANRNRRQRVGFGLDDLNVFQTLAVVVIPQRLHVFRNLLTSPIRAAVQRQAKTCATSLCAVDLGPWLPLRQ